MPLSPRLAPFLVLLLVLPLAAAAVGADGSTHTGPATAPDAPVDTVRVVTASGHDPAEAVGARSLHVALAAPSFGRSGGIRTRLARPGEAVALALDWPVGRSDRVEYRWVPVLGTAAGGGAGELSSGDVAVAPTAAGVYELELTDGVAEQRFGDRLRLLVLVPFESKRDGYIGRYFMGRWPTEGAGRTDRYAPPSGFIEVTTENQSLRLSEHFSLREFLTHDQGGVWPKYVVVDPLLLDKLELVLSELDAMGVPAHRMIVMSGFRTPQYNGKGLDQGRASLSRHQYGDAADVWVDNDADWYIDDLNGDGRRDTGDARVMLKAMERVEAKHPDLVGGGGIYADNGAHGPFLHIDVRGKRARW